MDSSKYRLAFDLHSHTTYSHGKGSIEDNVRAAIDRGLSHIAITDHGPGHLFFGVKREAIAEMRKEIDMLNAKYPKIMIQLSVEANIINKGNHLDVTPEEFELFDFVIAGYHYGLPHGYCVRNWLWNKGLKVGERRLMNKNTDMTIKALYENNIAILTHPGDKGPFEMRPIAEACADTDTLMEISTWHDHLTVDELKIAAQTDAQFIINSDAHHPKRIGDFEGGLERAIEAGIDLSRIVNLRGNK